MLITAVVALAGLILCAVVARSGKVDDTEAAVFDAINHLPDWLETPMWLMQLFGLLFTPAVVAIVALLLGQRRLALALVLLIPVKLFVERGILKELVERQRPGGTVDDPILRGVPSAGNSFPSGHAIIVGAMVTLLWPHLTRGWRIVALVVLGLALVARVYLGAHNPLDVIGGALAGVLIGLALALVTGDVRVLTKGR